jgi:hypothetical protein
MWNISTYQEVNGADRIMQICVVRKPEGSERFSRFSCSQNIIQVLFEVSIQDNVSVVGPPDLLERCFPERVLDETSTEVEGRTNGEF